jgi:hypothetical protein
MATNLAGTWVLTKSENFDNYARVIGVSEENRKKAADKMAKTGPSGYVEIIEVTPTTIKRTITVAGQEQNTSPAIPFGKEVDGQSLDGRPIKVTMTTDGPNKLTRTEKGPNYTSTIVTVVDGDKRTTTLVSGSVTAVREFRRQ